MIPNEEGWHCLAVKKLLVLLSGITSKHHGNFYCLNCLHSFATKNKLESHKNVCKKKGFRGIAFPTQKKKKKKKKYIYIYIYIIEFNQ